MTTETQAHSTKYTKPSENEIKVERTFDAPRNRVWQAHTDSQLLARWWGRGNKLDIKKNEPKPGGRWRFVEHGPDGEFGFEGEYREIVPQERIVQTFGWDGMPGHVIVTTATFQDLGGGDRTKVTNVMRFDSTKERDEMLKTGMEGGLNESYAALDRLLAE
jgi:uncharacterized protein YndB with AHSA1/START domain